MPVFCGIFLHSFVWPSFLICIISINWIVFRILTDAVFYIISIRFSLFLWCARDNGEITVELHAWTLSLFHQTRRIRCLAHVTFQIWMFRNKILNKLEMKTKKFNRKEKKTRHAFKHTVILRRSTICKDETNSSFSIRNYYYYYSICFYCLSFANIQRIYMYRIRNKRRKKSCVRVTDTSKLRCMCRHLILETKTRSTQHKK